MRNDQKATYYDVLIIGGGAAGFFTAMNLAKKAAHLSIAILERSKEVLSKVRISGGGRCNVTHAQFVPKELSLNYPRGEKELLGPFHTFMTGDTMTWFEDRGVTLKIEEDGRIFPTTDSSKTIIDCFLNETHKYKITVLKEHLIKEFTLVKAHSSQKQLWRVLSSKGSFTSKYLIVTTGSNPKMWKQLEKLSHCITPSVPSLFTFNIKDKRIEGLMGLTVETSVKVVGEDLASEGPLLITHWGMSGPGILKLSAWGALTLHKLGYNFQLKVNWLLYVTLEQAMEELVLLKNKNARQFPHSYAQFNLPKRLWRKLLDAAEITENQKWADLSKSKLNALGLELTEGLYQVTGKSIFKEEFVTAGGVNLKEINFKTFESKLIPNLYLAGEVLNIDAITGGFNFQNAWTGAYHIAQAIHLKES